VTSGKKIVTFFEKMAKKSLGEGEVGMFEQIEQKSLLSLQHDRENQAPRTLPPTPVAGLVSPLHADVADRLATIRAQKLLP